MWRSFQTLAWLCVVALVIGASLMFGLAVAATVAALFVLAWIIFGLVCVVRWLNNPRWPA